MKKLLCIRLLIISLLIASIQLTSTVVEAQDVGGIEVISTEIVNDYPDGLTFFINLQSDMPINSIKLYYKTQGSISTQSVPIEFEDSAEISASYTWDTTGFTVAPSTPILYYWQITDQDGNKHKTSETLIYFDDLRFDWQELSSSEIILRWYEGDAEFGSYIFDVANQALSQMKAETDRSLDFPVIILLYANPDDFNSWQFFAHDWIGGMAFPPLGVTAQIVPAASNWHWIEDVIPHEIAHLFFYQVINADTNSWPTWLNEGLSQYYEFSSNDAALELVEVAAQKGDLLTLVSISGDFGSDPERAYLAYDQSYSVVYYMLETWGQEGLQKLITNFHDGLAYREAIESAYQISWEEFEASWITWLGFPTTPAPPPTPTPTLVYMEAPQGYPTPTKFQTITPEPGSESTSPADIPLKDVTPVDPPPTTQNPVLVNSTLMTAVYVVGFIGLLVLIVIIVFKMNKK